MKMWQSHGSVAKSQKPPEEGSDPKEPPKQWPEPKLWPKMGLKQNSRPSIEPELQ